MTLSFLPSRIARPLARPAAMVLGLVLLAGFACTPTEAPESGEATAEAAGPVTVYSGRNESLVQPIFDRFTEQTGIEVKVRYGGTAELAATLLEEGTHTPADLFFSQDAAALGALSREGLLRPLAPAVLERVSPRYASPQGDWVGLSGRARTVVYNTETMAPEGLPTTLEEIGEARYRGRFGLAPANASFQAHMAAYRAIHGAEKLDELLTALAANEPQIYPKNTPIVEAAADGEIDFGLVNHYYLWRLKSERPDAPATNAFLAGGGASNFLNLAGAGLLSDSEGGRRLMDFLVSDEAQSYFAEGTYEYPLAFGVEASVELPALEGLESAQVDFGAVSEELVPTLEAIRTSGLLP